MFACFVYFFARTTTKDLVLGYPCACIAARDAIDIIMITVHLVAFQRVHLGVKEDTNLALTNVNFTCIVYISARPTTEYIMLSNPSSSSSTSDAFSIIIKRMLLLLFALFILCLIKTADLALYDFMPSQQTSQQKALCSATQVPVLPHKAQSA
jgi:hypothetical protein